MKVLRKIIEIDEELCDGCGECVTACEEGAIQIVDGKAKVVNDVFCDGLGACIGDCPLDALKIVEREAEEFDEVAVEHHLQELEPRGTEEQPTMACGCPSNKLQSFVPQEACERANQPSTMEPTESALSHWPVQIHLVPPTAPFLKNADLLVVADCVPVAYANFHRDFLQGKTVMMGCPKLDDGQSYVEKFADIFRTAGIKSLTVAIMEVPCCSGLPMIVKKALEVSGMDIPLEEVTIGIRDGSILNRQTSWQGQPIAVSL
ncbi:MAG: 4Fe-4S ferredoxin [Proteobacteria bacterium]|nr:4Fe-4S ferredoxin [Pseudomonadota bacterium]